MVPPPDDDTPVPGLFKKRSVPPPEPTTARPSPARPSDDSTALPRFGRSPGGADNGARKVLRNSAGRVHRVEYPEGTVREFKYDGAGKLSVVLNPDGTVWSRDGDGVWTQFGRDGETVARWKGHFAVDDAGHFLGECVFD